MKKRLNSLRAAGSLVLLAGIALNLALLVSRIITGEKFSFPFMHTHFYYNPAIYLFACVALLLIILPREWKNERVNGIAALSLFTIIFAGFQYDYYPLKIEGDGVAYFAYLHSLHFDRDIDFTNEYKDLHAARYGINGWRDEAGKEYYLPNRKTGYVANNFAIGPALLWYPAYAAVDFLYKRNYPQRNGYEAIYQNMIHFSHLCYGFLGLWFLYLALVRFFPAAISLVAVLAVALVSPFYYYLRNVPYYSHTVSFFAVSLFLYVFVRFRDHDTLRHWALLGALGGLAALMRWQNLLFLAVPFLYRLLGFLGVRPLSGRRFLSETARFAVYGGFAILLLLPQLILFRLMFGTVFLIPQGSTYLSIFPEWLFPALFSSFHGFFYWHPFMLTIVAGFVPPWKRLLPENRRLILAALGGFLIQVYFNATIREYWAGASFGARRFIDVLPFAVFGIALFLEKIWKRAYSRWLILLIFNMLFLFNVFLEKIFTVNKIDPQLPATYPMMIREIRRLLEYFWQNSPKYIYLSIVTGAFVVFAVLYLHRMTVKAETVSPK